MLAAASVGSPRPVSWLCWADQVECSPLSALVRLLAYLFAAVALRPFAPDAAVEPSEPAAVDITAAAAFAAGGRLS